MILQFMIWFSTIFNFLLAVTYCNDIVLLKSTHVYSLFLYFLSFKQHKTDFEVIPDKRPIRLPCEVSGCRCKTYSYVPLNGTQPIRCVCKHFSDDHGVSGAKKCMKPSCGCDGFYSAFTCACGDPCYNHQVSVNQSILYRYVYTVDVLNEVVFKEMVNFLKSLIH